MRRKVVTWLSALIEDPDGSPSSTRVAALLCTVTACFVAVYGVVTRQPEQAGAVTGLLAGAAGFFFSRKKSETMVGGE